MQLTDHIHVLKIPFQIPVAPGKILERFVYSYIITGPEITVIDSGVKGSYASIFSYLKNIFRDAGEIALLVLTHAHPDHIGSAAAIREKTGCTVAAHRDACAWIEDVDLQFSERPVPGFHDLVGGSTPVDRFLEDGEVIELGSIALEVLHTPGHSNGSISLYCREDGVLMSGDAIPRANDLPIYDDAAISARSIRKLMGLSPLYYLLASWSEPLAGRQAYEMMAEGLEYLQHIHDGVRKVSADKKEMEPMELCRRMVSVLGLPEVAVNPLIARSFASHLRLSGLEKLY